MISNTTEQQIELIETNLTMALRKLEQDLNEIIKRYSSEKMVSTSHHYFVADRNLHCQFIMNTLE